MESGWNAFKLAKEIVNELVVIGERGKRINYSLQHHRQWSLYCWSMARLMAKQATEPYRSTANITIFVLQGRLVISKK